MSGLWQSLRPRQWAKNLLVFVAPIGAGALFEPSVIVATVLAFVAFCCAASATYLVNDLVDRERDRNHPVKSDRPIASGRVSSTSAGVAAGVLVLAAGLIAFSTSVALGWVVAGYVAVTLAYSLYFKHMPVLELALLALGFLLRAVGGGAASSIPLSEWFLLVAGFGSLFMAAGKRYSEFMRLQASSGAGSGPVRGSLAGYSASYLRFVWTLSAGVTIATYCLWAVEVGGGTTIPWAMISIIPFTLGVLRYAVDIDASRGEAPDEVALSDRSLVALGAIWVVIFGFGALGVG